VTATPASGYPVLHTVDWTDADGVSHIWRTRIDRPLTDADRAVCAEAAEVAGINDLIGEYVAQGYTEQAATQKVWAIMMCLFAEAQVDEAAYRRECERRGLLLL
jgi:hypothetical protein